MAQPDNDDDELILLGRALTYLRKEAGLSQQQAADRLPEGGSAQNWGKYENGKAPTLFKPDVQRKVAGAVGADLETLQMVRARLKGERILETAAAMGERRYAHLVSPKLTIRQRLQAAWTFDDDKMNYGFWHVGRDPRWEHADQWLAEIFDDHAEGLGLYRGDLVQCVAATEIAYYPRDGELVVVARSRPGEERELTLRQVENSPTGTKLWARSTDTRIKNPLELPLTLHEAGDGPRILAYVPSAIRRF